MTSDETEEAFWNDARKSCVVLEESMSTPQPAYDLAERTARLGEAVIDFANIIPRTAILS